MRRCTSWALLTNKAARLLAEGLSFIQIHCLRSYNPVFSKCLQCYLPTVKCPVPEESNLFAWNWTNSRAQHHPRMGFHRVSGSFHSITCPHSPKTWGLFTANKPLFVCSLSQKPLRLLCGLFSPASKGMGFHSTKELVAAPPCLRLQELECVAGFLTGLGVFQNCV